MIGFELITAVLQSCRQVTQKTGTIFFITVFEFLNTITFLVKLLDHLGNDELIQFYDIVYALQYKSQLSIGENENKSYLRKTRCWRFGSAPYSRQEYPYSNLLEIPCGL